MAKKRSTYQVDPMDIDAKCDNKVRNTFAKTLNKLLSDKGIDQIVFAEMLGIGTGTLSNYRVGLRQPPLETIVQMANILEVDCNYLITGIRAKDNNTSRLLGLSGECIEAITQMDADEKEMLDLLLRSGFEGVLDYLSIANAILKNTESEDLEDNDWDDNDIPTFTKNNCTLSARSTVKFLINKAVESSSITFNSLFGYRWTIAQRRLLENTIRQNKALIKQLKAKEDEDGKH